MLLETTFFPEVQIAINYLTVLRKLTSLQQVLEPRDRKNRLL